MQVSIPFCAALVCLLACSATSASAPPVAGQDAAPAADAPGADLPAAATEYVATQADFDCVKHGTQVGHFFIANRLGHLDAAVAVAKTNAAGASYPLGTVIRLFPLEAMVKRGGTAFAATGGWEMFRLKYTATGTDIAQRGGAEVSNAAGSCVGCHAPAKAFDFVCGNDHGCAPLNASEEIIKALQDGDPACP